MNDQKKLLRRIQAYCFVLAETNLYLDTHPYCRQALRYFEKYRELRDEAVRQYEARYGGLTALGADAGNCWNWVTEPFPWEA